MNRSEAKEILAAFRPGVDSETDSLFAEALSLARQDPELAAWLEESVRFDQRVSGSLDQVQPSPDLRETILSQARIVRPQVPWWHYRLSAPQFAAAAVLLLALGLAGFAGWYRNQPISFADFQREIVDQSWGTRPHVEVATSNLVEVRKFLAAHRAPADFELPPAMAHLAVQGCSLVEWRGRQIPFLCFASGGQHFHMVVVERGMFHDAPDRPQIDRWQAWRTAAWSKDSHTFMTTGLSSIAFLKLFRRVGYWDWES